MDTDTTRAILDGHPPLPADEQLALVRQAQAGLTARVELSANGHDPTRRAELEPIVAAGSEASERLVLHNSRLVQMVVLRSQGRGVPNDDLFQEGAIGLMTAIAKFDPGRDIAFSTYATWWIRQAITRAIADQSRAIRLPVHQHERVNRIRRIGNDLAQMMGHWPDENAFIDAVAAGGETPAYGVMEILAVAGAPRSIDAPVGDDTSVLGDFLPDPVLPTADQITAAQVAARVGAIVNELPSREAEVIQRHYGLNGYERQTLGHIGQVFGLTRERIRQIEAIAMRRLRHLSACAD